MTTPTTPATDVKRYYWNNLELVERSAFDALAAENERLRGERDKLSRDVSLLEIVGKDQAEALRELRAKCEAHGRHYETERETNSVLNGENHALSYSVTALIAERDAATAEVGRLRAWLERDAWSMFRSMLSQGMDIQMDMLAGKYASYEHLSARLDAAARERSEALIARLSAPSPTNSDGANSDGEEGK